MKRPRRLFDCFGVELEYMIVNRGSLDVLPAADEVLREAAGAYVSDLARDKLAWSNELVLHVIELKTNGPARQLDGLATLFQRDVRHINRILEPMSGVLLPTGMHPWMDPDTQTKLWPHESNAIYESFNRIFDCRGHGWSNVQSAHLNLPFHGDAEFGALHAAVRLVLPILPALAASSPIVDGRSGESADARLEAYRVNCRRIPSVTGRVIPEPVFTRRTYEAQILRPMYADIGRHDPDGILRHEWLNARGAIARFDRSTIEIRLLDVQECPQADLAVLALTVAALQAMVQQRWSDLDAQKHWETVPLERILLRTIRDAEAATIDDPDYLRMFGSAHGAPRTAGQLWRHIYDTALSAAWREEFGGEIEAILDRGTLATRIRSALGRQPDRNRICAVYRELSHCLAEGRMFPP